MARSFKIFIPGRLPDFNQFEREARGNKYQAANTKKQWIAFIAGIIRTNLGNKKYYQVRLRFKWIEPNQRRDPDNITSAQKLVIDGLVKAGLINNDGWKQIKSPLVHDWEIGQKQGVILTIEPIGKRTKCPHRKTVRALKTVPRKLLPARRSA